MLGVDANYSLELESKGIQWRWNSGAKDLFSGIRNEGARSFRVRLWTEDEGINGKWYATKIVQRAVQAGLNPYLVLFLSDDWADMTKQPAPKRWKDLPLEERLEAVRNYSRKIVTHFRSRGLTSHLYEIGNEIDYGICGVYPEKGAGKNPEDLRKDIWLEAGKIILACQDGIKEADPDAKFLLHIAHWWEPEFCVAFFKFMREQNVKVDYAGLSYFPSSNLGGSLTLGQFRQTVDRINAAIDRPLIIAETAYPSSSEFTGQFATWRKQVPGYPLTPEGQERWLTDFVRFCSDHPAIAGLFYWSPEWCGQGMWKAFALFDPDGNAKPAWQAFRSNRGTMEPDHMRRFGEPPATAICATTR